MQRKIIYPIPEGTPPLNLEKIDVLSWFQSIKEDDYSDDVDEVENKEVNNLVKFLQLMEAFNQNKVTAEFLREQFGKKSEEGLTAIYYITKHLISSENTQGLVLSELVDTLIPNNIITPTQFAASDKMGTNATFNLVAHHVGLEYLDKLIELGMITKDGLSVQFKVPDEKAGANEDKKSEGKSPDVTKVEDNTYMWLNPKFLNHMNVIGLLLSKMLYPVTEESFKWSWNCFMHLLTSEARGGPSLITADLLTEDFCKKLFDDYHPKTTYDLQYRVDEIWKNQKYKAWMNTWLMALNMIAAPAKINLIPLKDKDLVDYKQPSIFQNVTERDRYYINLIKQSMMSPINEQILGVPWTDTTYKKLFLEIIVPYMENYVTYFDYKIRDEYKKEYDFENTAELYSKDLTKCQFYNNYFENYLMEIAKKELLQESTQVFKDEVGAKAKEAVLRCKGGHWKATTEWLNSFKEMLQLGIDDFFKEHPGHYITKEAQKKIIDDLVADLREEVVNKKEIIDPERVVEIIANKLNVKENKTAEKKEIPSVAENPNLMFSNQSDRAATETKLKNSTDQPKP